MPESLGYATPKPVAYRTPLLRAFDIASAVSALLCVAAVGAQAGGFGVPLAAGVRAGIPGERGAQSFVIYGVAYGNYSVPFVLIYLSMAVLPGLWLMVFVVRFALRGSRF